MKDFLQKIINGNGISPPKICLQSFRENFPDALNIEWFQIKGYYEAIFYQHTTEYIALFNLDGFLAEYKQNLPIDLLPEKIKDHASNKGEIMNIVLNNKGNLFEYELIVRDKLHIRYLLNYSDTGDIKEENIL